MSTSLALFLGSTGYLTYLYSRYLDDARTLEKGKESDGEQILNATVSEIVKLETDDTESNPPTYLHIGTVAGIAFPLGTTKSERKTAEIYSHVKLTAVESKTSTPLTLTNPTIYDWHQGTVCYINTPEDLTNRMQQFNIDRTSLRLKLPLKLTHTTVKPGQSSASAYTNKQTNMFGFSPATLARVIAKRRVNWTGATAAAGLAAYSGYRLLRD